MTVRTPLISNNSDNSTTECCKDETVGPYDVLCGRNKAAFNNVGNRRFRVNVARSLDKYMNVASTRKEKSQVIREVIMITRACGGRFIIERQGKYEELSDRQTHEKVGHAVRDMLNAREKVLASKSAFETISALNGNAKSLKNKAVPEDCRSFFEKPEKLHSHESMTIISYSNNDNKLHFGKNHQPVLFSHQQYNLREDDSNILSKNNNQTSLYERAVPLQLVANISLASACGAPELDRGISIASIDSNLTFDRDFFESSFFQ